jgi:hypothetical protein
MERQQLLAGSKQNGRQGPMSELTQHSPNNGDHRADQERDRQRLVLSIVITVIFVTAAIVHLVWPDLSVDAVTLGLLIIAAVPWLAPIVRSIEVAGFKIELRELRERIQRVEGLFTFTGEATLAQEARLREALQKFMDYLGSLSPTQNTRPTEPTIHVDKDTPYDYWIDRGGYRLVIGVGLVNDPHVITHQYGHLFLENLNQVASGSTANAPVEAALADYFACSFDGRPVVLTTEVSSGDRVGQRELSEKLIWGGAQPRTVHQQGEVLAAALWAVRETITKEVCDTISLITWVEAAPGLGVEGYVHAFLGHEALLADHRRERVSNIFGERELLGVGHQVLDGGVQDPRSWPRSFLNRFRR